MNFFKTLFIFVFIVCATMALASSLSEEENGPNSKLAKSNGPVQGLNSKKKLNQFLLPTVMWLQYKNDRKKMLKKQKKSNQRMLNNFKAYLVKLINQDVI